MVRLYHQTHDGMGRRILPESGGLLDQCALTVAALDTVWAEQPPFIMPVVWVTLPDQGGDE